jgi:hypothetical protein
MLILARPEEYIYLGMAGGEGTDTLVQINTG